MARTPNFIGSQSPWGQALSNLGTALFGDPSEQLRQKQAESEMEYRTEQIANLRFQRQLQQQEAERIAAARLKVMGGGGTPATTAPVAPTAQPAVDPTAAAAAEAALTTGPQTQLAQPFIEPEGPQPSITQETLPVTPTKVSLPLIPGQPAGVVTPATAPQYPVTYASGGRPTAPAAPAAVAQAPAPTVVQANYTPVAATTGADAARKALTGPVGLYDALGLTESGDNWNADAPTSSAAGRYQFIGTPDKPSTAQAVAKALGLPLDQTQWTHAQQQQAAEYLTNQELQQARRVLGREPTATDLYALHHFGAGAGAKIITSPSTTPMASIVGAHALQVNGYPLDMTVGDFYDRYGSQFGMGQPFEGQDTASLTPEQRNELLGPGWDGSMPDATVAATDALHPVSSQNAALAAAHPELASMVDVQHRMYNRTPPDVETGPGETGVPEATEGEAAPSTLLRVDGSPVVPQPPQPPASAAAAPAPQQASLADSDLFSAADQTAEATAPAMPGDMTQAAQTAAGGTPTDVFAQLDDYDKAILAMTPDAQFDEALAKILTNKQKKLGSGEWLGGEGLDQQMYNTVVTYELMKQQGQPTTPAQDLQYKMAVAHLEEPKLNPQTGQVSQVKLPHVWTPETPASPEVDTGTGGTGAQQQQQAAAEQQQTTVNQPKVVRQTPFGSVQEMVNQDGTITRRIGNLEITTPADAGSKLSIEDSAKVAGLENGLAELSHATGILAPKGKVDRSELAAGTINLDSVIDLGIGQGLPWTKGRSARQAILRGIESVKRAYTGAALTGSEKVDFDSMFVPNYWDDDVEVKRKLAALDNWVRGTYNNFVKGRPQFAAIGTPGAEQWWQQSASANTAAPEQTTGAGNADVALPGGTEDNPLNLNLPKR